MDYGWTTTILEKEKGINQSLANPLFLNGWSDWGYLGLLPSALRARASARVEK
jgi:hypothetical protein